LLFATKPKAGRHLFEVAAEDALGNNRAQLAHRVQGRTSKPKR
jgi:hypothetical protein